MSRDNCCFGAKLSPLDGALGVVVVAPGKLFFRRPTLTPRTFEVNSLVRGFDLRARAFVAERSRNAL